MAAGTYCTYNIPVLNLHEVRSSCRRSLILPIGVNIDYVISFHVRYYSPYYLYVSSKVQIQTAVIKSTGRNVPSLSPKKNHHWKISNRKYISGKNKARDNYYQRRLSCYGSCAQLFFCRYIGTWCSPSLEEALFYSP